jgi:hypothetical protein
MYLSENKFLTFFDSKFYGRSKSTSLVSLFDQILSDLGKPEGYST